jgi:hypothetical protein
MKLLWQYAPEGLLRLAYGEGSWRPVQVETVERVQYAAGGRLHRPCEGADLGGGADNPVDIQLR